MDGKPVHRAPQAPAGRTRRNVAEVALSTCRSPQQGKCCCSLVSRRLDQPPMDTRDLNRVFESLQGDSALLRAVPGFPVVAITRTLRAVSADPGNALGRPYFESFPDSPQAAGSVATLTASFERVIRSRSTDHHTQPLGEVDPSTGQFVE